MQYDEFAKYYDRAFAPFEKRYLSAWRREALSHLPSHSVLLELGAGTGANFEFYPSFHTAVASEISIEMIRRAKPKSAGHLLLQADAQDLPFDDYTFDAAFATLVFCTIPDPKRAFRELTRVVKPGGTIALLEHVRPTGIAGYFFDALSVATVALAGDHFDRETATIAESSGLGVVKLRKMAGGIFNIIVCRTHSAT